MSKYHYNIEKKETNANPGIINLKKIKKTSGGKIKPQKVSFRDLLTDTRDLLLTFMNEQHEVNKRQEEFNKTVLDQFKKHKWTK